MNVYPNEAFESFVSNAPLIIHENTNDWIVNNVKYGRLLFVGFLNL